MKEAKKLKDIISSNLDRIEYLKDFQSQAMEDPSFIGLKFTILHFQTRYIMVLIDKRHEPATVMYQSFSHDVPGTVIYRAWVELMKTPPHEQVNMAMFDTLYGAFSSLYVIGPEDWLYQFIAGNLGQGPLCFDQELVIEEE